MSAHAEIQTACRHCGTQFSLREAESESGFCCAGCHFVYRWINESGLERFYEIKGGRSTAPVKSQAFQERDFSWLREAAAAAEAEVQAADAPASLELDVQGISCVACVWLIENVFQREKGGLRIAVNAHLGRARLWWTPGKFDIAAFGCGLQRFGYLLGPATGHAERRGGSRDLLVRLGLCAAFALNAMAFTLPRYLGMDPDFELSRLFQLIVVVSATFCLLAGGSYFLRRAWEGLRRGRLHIDFPISLGILFAFGGSMAGWMSGTEALLYFDFVAVFIFLMLLGRWVQQAAVEANRNRLLAGDARPGRVTLYDDENAAPAADPVQVALAGVMPGNILGIGPGQVIPVGGELCSREAELSLEWINGEPEARHWKRSRPVPAGAINIGRHEVRIRARERFEDSVLAKLLAPAPCEENRDPRLEKILRVYLVAVIGIAGAGAAGWLAADTGGWVKALQVAISVLVVSCPCALGIALPLANERAVSAMRRMGLFVRSNDLWARLGRVRQIVFDKTGTLTLEIPRLLNPEALGRLGPRERAVLGRLVTGSLHPFSRSLREILATEDPVGDAFEIAEESAVEEIAGRGVTLVEAGSAVLWSLGREERAESGGSEGSGSPVDCVFCRNGEVLARFRFCEELRPDAVGEVERLGRRGLAVCILSGDRPEKVKATGARLGLRGEDCLGGMSPEAKADWMVRRGGADSLYLGDGANDSLAFGEAACRGTPAVDSGVLQEKSDFYFLGQGLGAIRALFEINDRRRRAVRRVFAFSASYNAIAVGLSLAGWMNPLLAAVLMPASAVLSLILAGSDAAMTSNRWPARRGTGTRDEKNANGGGAIPDTIELESPAGSH